MRSCVVLLLLLAIAAPILQAGTVVSVESGNAANGSTVNIPVSITGVTDLYAFQFDVSYDPTILQTLSITEGSFLPSTGATFFIPGTIDNIGGTVTFNADTLIGAIPGASGGGTLVTLDFDAIANGVSALTLANVILLDSNFNDISFTTQAGQVTVGSTVPEPNTLWLLLCFIILCYVLKWRWPFHSLYNRGLH